MDKKLINAVAGSGKTTKIISSLSLEKKFLIIAYTTENIRNIYNKIIKKFDYFPKNIFLFSFYEFLFQFCYRPFFSLEFCKGICFEMQNNIYHKNTHTKEGRVYSNMLSKLLLNNKSLYTNRIDKYFDEVFIDEIQDFGSHDYDWILSLSLLKTKVTLLGDFYQHTFQTSTLGNKRVNLYKDYDKYKKEFITAGFIVDETMLSGSWRCTGTVCSFIEKNLNIFISSNKEEISEIIFLDDDKEIEEIIFDDLVVKLFYSKHYSYRMKSNNWGNAKGLTYDSVCVVLNPKTYKLYKNNKLNELAATTLNKFYVACSRTKSNLYFVEEKRLNKYKK